MKKISTIFIALIMTTLSIAPCFAGTTETYYEEKANIIYTSKYVHGYDKKNDSGTIHDWLSIEDVLKYAIKEPKNISTKPIIKITKTSKKIKIKVNNIPNKTFYEIKYSTNKKFKKATTIKTNKRKYIIKKLKKKKKYYIKVRFYQKYYFVKVNRIITCNVPTPEEDLEGYRKYKHSSIDEWLKDERSKPSSVSYRFSNNCNIRYVYSKYTKTYKIKTK